MRPLATSLETRDRLTERGADAAMRSLPRTAFGRTMDKPRIFLGSSGKQEKLLQALTRGLEGIAHVDPWTTSFQPGTTTLERLVELAHEVDFAAFVFAQDDWTSTSPPASPGTGSSQASPRDNVVFEAGLFGGALGMRRTFIIHANGSKLPSDLLGLTSVRYDEKMTPSEMKVINQKLKQAIENEGRMARIEGFWWQFSLTERGPREPSAVSLLRISRNRDGALEIVGRSWQEDGTLSARYWSEAAKEKKEPSGVFYYWKGERPLHPNAPQLDGTGEIRMETADRAAGYWTTRADTDPTLNARTSGVYLRADPKDTSILDGRDDRRRAELIAEQLKNWKSITKG
jgi:predicted nucleotide-binding protein